MQSTKNDIGELENLQNEFEYIKYQITLTNLKYTFSKTLNKEQIKKIISQHFENAADRENWMAYIERLLPKDSIPLRLLSPADRDGPATYLFFLATKYLALGYANNTHADFKNAEICFAEALEKGEGLDQEEIETAKINIANAKYGQSLRGYRDSKERTQLADEALETYVCFIADTDDPKEHTKCRFLSNITSRQKNKEDFLALLLAKTNKLNLSLDQQERFWGHCMQKPRKGHDSYNCLANFFWHQQGKTPCTIIHGTLSNILNIRLNIYLQVMVKNSEQNLNNFKDLEEIIIDVRKNVGKNEIWKRILEVIEKGSLSLDEQITLFEKFKDKHCILGNMFADSKRLKRQQDKLSMLKIEDQHAIANPIISLEPIIPIIDPPAYLNNVQPPEHKNIINENQQVNKQNREKHKSLGLPFFLGALNQPKTGQKPKKEEKPRLLPNQPAAAEKPQKENSNMQGGHKFTSLVSLQRIFSTSMQNREISEYKDSPGAKELNDINNSDSSTDSEQNAEENRLNMSKE